MRNKLENNWETLKDSTKEIIKELIIDADNAKRGPDGHKQGEDAIEELEFRSRSGFIAFSDNCGGIRLRNFTDLMDYFASGYDCAHEKANEEINRQIEDSLKCAQEDFEEKHPEHKGESYHSLYEKKLDKLAEELSSLETKYLCGENSSIMQEFRFLYHGKNEQGLHHASVSAAINTEGPYHRSSIPWAPNVFCEGAKEIEIEWTTNSELKTKLKNALKNCSEEIF